MLAPVWLLLQFIVPVQLVALRVILSPAHIIFFEATAVGARGTAVPCTLIPVELLLVHVFTLHVAVYMVSLLVAGTEILAPVEPLDHVTVPEQPAALKFTF
jgi:hypothetical protein